MSSDLSYSHVVSVTPDVAFARIIDHPLTEIFSRRYLVFPPIRETRDQTGPWNQIGVSRTIVLSDGGMMRETLTSVSPPHSFGYRIDDVRGLLAPFVSVVDGLWRFAAVDDRTEISWSWTVLTTPAGTATMPVFARIWRGYARSAMREVERIVTAP